MTALSTRSVLLMLLAMTLIPLGDAAGKLLMRDFGAAPFFVGWSRFTLGAAVVGVGIAIMGQRPDFRAFGNWRLWLRGGLIGAGVASIVSALQTEPIANVFGAFFIGPILSYFLSAWLLREPLSGRRTVLLLTGFAGVLLVVRPGFGMTAGLALAVLAGVFYGLFLTANRWLRDAAQPKDLLLTQLVAAALLLAPLGAFQWPEVTPASLGLTVVSSMASMSGNLLLIFAYKQTPAGQLAPFVYFQLVAATLFGLLLFGSFPDALALVGLAVLTVSGFATLFIRRL